MQALKILWILFSGLSTILGVAGFFITGETRDAAIGYIATFYNYIHPLDSITFVPLDPKLATVRLYPKYFDENQKLNAEGITTRLRSLGVAAFRPDEDDIQLCRHYTTPTIIYHDEKERVAAMTAAAAADVAILKLAINNAPKVGVDIHPENAGKYTYNYFAMCVAGLPALNGDRS